MIVSPGEDSSQEYEYSIKAVVKAEWCRIGTADLDQLTKNLKITLQS